MRGGCVRTNVGVMLRLSSARSGLFILAEVCITGLIALLYRFAYVMGWLGYCMDSEGSRMFTCLLSVFVW